MKERMQKRENLLQHNEYNITEMPCGTRYMAESGCAILDSLIKRNRNRTETFFKWIEWSSYCYGGSSGGGGGGDDDGSSSSTRV